MAFFILSLLFFTISTQAQFRCYDFEGSSVYDMAPFFGYTSVAAVSLEPDPIFSIFMNNITDSNFEQCSFAGTAHAEFPSTGVPMSFGPGVLTTFALAEFVSYTTNDGFVAVVIGMTVWGRPEQQKLVSYTTFNLSGFLSKSERDAYRQQLRRNDVEELARQFMEGDTHLQVLSRPSNPSSSLYAKSSKRHRAPKSWRDGQWGGHPDRDPPDYKFLGGNPQVDVTLRSFDSCFEVPGTFTEIRLMSICMSIAAPQYESNHDYFAEFYYATGHLFVPENGPSQSALGMVSLGVFGPPVLPTITSTSTTGTTSTPTPALKSGKILKKL
jgi:hypothetical protein